MHRIKFWIKLILRSTPILRSTQFLGPHPGPRPNIYFFGGEKSGCDIFLDDIVSWVSYTDFKFMMRRRLRIMWFLYVYTNVIFKNKRNKNNRLVAPCSRFFEEYIDFFDSVFSKLIILRYSFPLIRMSYLNWTWNYL